MLALRLAAAGKDQLPWLSASDFRSLGYRVSSVRGDLLYREKNLEPNEPERPNSPLHNPSSYQNVMLETGEYVKSELDWTIRGRGFDFVFTRTYVSA